ARHALRFGCRVELAGPARRRTEDVLRVEVELAYLAGERHDVAVVADPEDHVRVRGSDLAEDRAEVSVAARQGRLERLDEDDLLARTDHHTGRRLGAWATERRVLVQQGDGVGAGEHGELAGGLGVLVVPRVDVEEPRLRADELLDAVETVDADARRRAADPADERLEGAERLDERQRDARGVAAADELDAVLGHQLLEGRHGRGRVGLGVLDDDLERLSEDATGRVDLFDRQLEPGELRLARAGGRAGQRREDADLDLGEAHADQAE